MCDTSEALPTNNSIHLSQHQGHTANAIFKTLLDAFDTTKSQIEHPVDD